jgi:hypothetical protein
VVFSLRYRLNLKYYLDELQLQWVMEEHRLRAYESGRQEAFYTNDRRINIKMEELHTLFYSPNIIMLMKSWIRWTSHVARIGHIRNTCKSVKYEMKLATIFIITDL